MKKTFGFAALCVLLLAGRMGAQTITTGDVTGTITDTSGAVVPNVAVTLRNLDNGQTRTASGNGSGQYRFSSLQPGSYQISAETPGLRSDNNKILVSIGQVASVDLILKPETAITTVTVTESVPLLQVDNANQSTTLTGKQIQNLPLPGGDTTTVAFTAPGVIVSTGGGYGNFSSHGLPGTSNLFTVNGNDNNDPYLNLNNSGASNLTLGANEVAEIAVVQNAYTASYGRNAGAQVNTVTKAGTNEFHGNARWDWNGALLNANDFFNNSTGTPKGRANSNQYAVSGGGPIWKNHTFFFADYEGIRYILPSAGVVSAPTVDFENYILSQIAPSQTAFYQKAFALYNAAPGINRAVDVQNGDGQLQDSTGALGCGSLSPVGPLANGKTLGVDASCARAFGTNVTNKNTEWLFTARLDHQINDKQRIFFRYKVDHGVQATGTDPINSAFNTNSVQPAYEGQVDHTFILTPNVVNHIIGAGSWYSALFGPADLKQTLGVFPTALYFSEGGANGTGSFNTLGLGNAYPQGRRVGQAQIVDDLSINRGNHTLKFGVNFRKNRVTDTSPGQLQQGYFSFGSVDDFANGIVVSGNSDLYAQRFANSQANHLRLYNVGFYAQDEWSVAPGLKLTFGIRFDRTANPSCLENCFSRLNDAFSNIAHGASTPYNQSITTGLSTLTKSVESIIPAPRFGFVYNPAGSKKTVIRGGFGLFSDQPPATLVSSVFGNSPNIYTPSVRLGLVGTADVAGSSPSIAIASNSAFRSGFSNGFNRAQIQASLPAGVTFTPPAYFSVPNELLSPKYLEWSFEIQREIGTKSVVNIGYTGNRGYNLFLENQMLNTYNQNSLSAYGFLPSAAPDPRFRIITNLQNNGHSSYHGLTTQYRRTLAFGFQGQVSYTWSHALDDISNGGLREFFNGNDSLTTQLYPYSKVLNYASADYDIRHNVVGDFSWELPFKFHNKLLSGIAGGWTMGGKFYARTGTPFSVTVSAQAGRISSSTGGSVLAAVTDPNINVNCGSSSVDNPCFTSSQFAVRGFGNFGRNLFRGPNYVNIDYSVLKSFRVSESAKFAFGASFYNLLNHPNFASPGHLSNVGGLGIISSTVTAPTSAYGAFEGSAVSGRVIVSTARFTF